MDNNSPITVLGFDFGTKRIGTAVGQTLTKTAQPLMIIKAENGVPDWQAVVKLIETWQANILVVGIPLNMDGTEQAVTEMARQFCRQLAKHTQLPIYPVDERLTTVEAKARIFAEHGYRGLQKGYVDSIAAQLIVEDWLAQSERK